MASHELEFSPINPSHYAVFFSLEDNCRAALSAFPETLSRIEGALHFAHRLRIAGEEGPEERLAGSYLRASLAEYVAIDEMAKAEFDNDFSLLKTRCPLPHILKILRNYQMHIGTTKVSEENMELLYRGETFELGKWVVTDVESGHLLSLHAFTDNRGRPAMYSEQTAEKMVEWLNESQRTFGFPHLIHTAVMDVCNQLRAGTY